jgi:hypothetical protein
MVRLTGDILKNHLEKPAIRLNAKRLPGLDEALSHSGDPQHVALGDGTWAWCLKKTSRCLAAPGGVAG